MRQRVSSGSSYEASIGFSRAVRVDRQVFVSATAAIWPDGHVDPDVGDQARRSLAIIEASLREAGASLEDVVRTRIFLVDAADGEAVGAVHGEVFGAIRPASGFIVVSGFLDPRWRVERRTRSSPATRRIWRNGWRNGSVVPTRLHGEARRRGPGR